MSTTPEQIVDSRFEKWPSRPRSRPKKLSLRTAINEKCKECIVDPVCGTGNWRQQITACTSRTCPIYPVRPLSNRRA